MCWTVYILYSPTLDRFYVGCSNDFDGRLIKHGLKFYGKESFTAKADDWEVFLHFNCKDEKQAKSIERHIKKMKSRNFIENLKSYPEMIQKLILKYSI